MTAPKNTDAGIAHSASLHTQPGAADNAAYPFAFGSKTLPGLAKVNEECGEAVQQIGKLMMTGGSPRHWEGGDLIQNAINEMADIQAAIDFFRAHNVVDFPAFAARVDAKRALFEQWHTEQAQ